MYNSHPPPITYCTLLCIDDHDDDVDNDRNCDDDEDVLTEISSPNRLHVAFDFTRSLFQATQRVVLRTTDTVLVPIGAHNRPNSRRLDRSRQKSSPTGRHKTTPEQFKHTFATNLHDHKWSQSRSKLEELTSEAVGEASFAARVP